MGALPPLPPVGLSPLPPGGAFALTPRWGFRPYPPVGLSPLPPGGAFAPTPRWGFRPYPRWGLRPLPPGGAFGPYPPVGLSAPTSRWGLRPYPPVGPSALLPGWAFGPTPRLGLRPLHPRLLRFWFCAPLAPYSFRLVSLRVGAPPALARPAASGKGRGGEGPSSDLASPALPICPALASSTGPVRLPACSAVCLPGAGAPAVPLPSGLAGIAPSAFCRFASSALRSPARRPMVPPGLGFSGSGQLHPATPVPPPSGASVTRLLSPLPPLHRDLLHRRCLRHLHHRLHLHRSASTTSTASVSMALLGFWGGLEWL